MKKIIILLLFILFLISSCDKKTDIATKEPVFSGYQCINCNVLFIVLDTVRYDRLSADGYERNTTPFLNTYGNVKFNNHHTNIPFTPLAHWSIFTSTYPHTNNMTYSSDDPAVPYRVQNESLQLLPIILNDSGYYTSAIVNTRMLTQFQYFFDNWELQFHTKTENPLYPSQNIIEWLDENKNKTFFLFGHYWDAHEPYEPPKDYDVFTGGINNKSDKYDGEILFLDSKVKMVIDELKRLRLENKTIVIITSDHGENFGEQDCSIFTGEEGACWAHLKSLYEEELHVPLIIYLPELNHSVTINDLTQHIDLLPTILDILNITIPPKNIEGSSLLPLIKGEHFNVPFVFSELARSVDNKFSGLMIDNWKLSIIKTKGDTSVVLFNTSNEDKNIKDEYPDVTEQMIIMLKNVQGSEQISASQYDTETEKLLRSLGYIN